MTVPEVSAGSAALAPVCSARRRSDAGVAVAEFVMVSALLSLVFLAVIQLGLALHVRNTVIDSAVAGARLAARPDATGQQGAELTAQLISTSVSSRYADRIEVDYGRHSGEDIVTVTVTTPVPVIGLLGPTGTWELSGRALVEDING
ncbi:TadE/TadG family type IV pilus assembly protein [Brevibacterium otitidis]|uniref:TadE/TadG family type IV pilus assembly protein n=1 Tax=Brevibacterium otitidis TaxID=53364 RepID=UPI00360F5BAA|nr:hypothetical protein GCM10023233_07940 [Brevibacterium otitidis]